jgi:hypothetical protein
MRGFVVGLRFSASVWSPVHEQACMSATCAVLQGCAQCFTAQCLHMRVLLCDTRHVLAVALPGGLATCTLRPPGYMKLGRMH